MQQQLQLNVYTKNDRLRALLSEYEDETQDGSPDESEYADERYVLVERNWRGPREVWMGFGEDVGELLHGHINQEYAEDWEFIGIYDLAEGLVYEDLIVSPRVGPATLWTIESHEDGDE